MEDDLCDALGIIFMLKGIFLRMSARGHKMSHSNNSESLVTTGPYSYIRNPMYTGTCLIGAGFVLLVWPWWMIVPFVAAFTVRFMKQVKFEEVFLTEHFKEEYTQYCEEVPRFFPRLDHILFIKSKVMFNPDELFKTKEARNILTWLPFAIILEALQEWVVYGQIDIMKTVLIVIITTALFAVVFWVSLKIE